MSLSMTAHRQFLAAGLLCLILSVGTRANGSPAEDVPLDSWVYDAVFELSTQGYFSAMLLHTRPWSRGEIAQSIEHVIADGETLPSGQQILFDRLRNEFAEELDRSVAAEADGGQYVRLGGGPTARTDQIRQGIARNRAGADIIGSFGIGDVLAVRTRVRFDSDARYDSQFHGEYWKEKFTAWVEQSVLTVQYHKFRGAFGREFWRWGRSPVDAMLISDQSPPFDGLRLTYRAHNWSFSFHATVLDSMTDDLPGTTNRYLVGHRLDWRPRHNLELAISEVMVYGGPDRPWAWNYVNPFVPYYWEQLNNSTNDNPLWNLECSWRPRDFLEFYGEWMIDDFQIDFTSEPQQIGVLLGAAWTGGPGRRAFVNAEYERINTFVYGQSRPYNRYYHDFGLGGIPTGIGSNLGADADRIILRPSYHCTVNCDITGLLEHVRHGADRLYYHQNSGVPKNIPFPSGVVERRTTAGAGVHAQIGGHAIFDCLLGFERVTNIGNTGGYNRDGFLFQARFTGLIWKTLRI